MYKRNSSLFAYKKRILIVEDDETLCLFLKEDLQKGNYLVDVLHYGELLPKQLGQYCTHLIILDIMLPNKDGIYWLKWIKQYYPQTPVIITSAKSSPEDRLLGLEKGAVDYLVKPFHTKEVVLKVNRVLAEITNKNTTLLTIGDVIVNTEEKYVDKQNNKLPLTNLECKILQLLYLNAGIPLSRDDIMQQSMGMQYIPTNRSIDIHINRLRNKIEKTPKHPKYIQTIRGKGYCLHLPNP
ncbi:MAG: response regulator transcription factor [bacterium]